VGPGGRIPLIAPQQNAVPAASTGQVAASAAPAPGTTAALAGTTIGARGLLDADTTDDLIVDVPDDSDTGDTGGELSTAITTLPAEVQMNGYRFMWALAGLVSLGAAVISYYMRDAEESEAEGAPASAGPPPARTPAGAPARP